MATATWNEVVIAESSDTVVVEGNHYFPTSAVKPDVLRPSAHTSVCGWKGTANYYDVVVNGDVNSQAAWFYPEPLAGAQQVAGRIAFWKGVTITD